MKTSDLFLLIAAICVSPHLPLPVALGVFTGGVVLGLLLNGIGE